VTSVRYYPRICWRDGVKPSKPYNNWSAGLCMISEPPEYEARMVNTRLICSVFIEISLNMSTGLDYRKILSFVDTAMNILVL
jgi:hypothetical protein